MRFSHGFWAAFTILALALPAPSHGERRTTAATVDETNLPHIVAKVNGVEIKKAELQNAAETMKMQFEVIGQPMPPDKRDEIWRRLLKEIIDTELLAQETARKKLTVAESDVDAELARFRERFPSEAVFASFLKEQSFNEKQIREEIRKQLSIKKMLDREVFAKTRVDAVAAEVFYRENSAQFQEPEAVKASHILVKVERSADESAKAKARQKAEQILAKAKAGTDFAQLAKEHSDDPGSKDRGGDLDFFARGQMVPDFDDAAFKLDKGEISNIVSTAFGFHVIKVTDKRPRRAIPFADVKDDLIVFLKEKEKADMLKSYVESLRKKATVQIFI